MCGKIKFIMILILAVIITDASAQNNQVLYFMNLPQNHQLNPAIRPSNSIYIGLPVISGINVNINNNFINLRNVFLKGQSGDSVYSFIHRDYNADSFLAKTKDNNYVEPESSVQLFGIGFSAGKSSYFFLDINERVEGNIVIPGDLIKFFLKGNEGFIGHTIDLSSFKGDLKYYREIGLGFSKNFTDKLRIGVKGKLLFGITAATVDNHALGISVNNDLTHTLDADLNVNISGPVIAYMSSENKLDSLKIDKNNLKTSSQILGFLFDPKNFGLGLDIGATYELSDRLMISAAITDLGFINWKNDITSLQANSHLEINGLTMLDVYNKTKTFDQLGQAIQGTIRNSFVVSSSKAPFTTYIPFGVSLGGSYNVTSQFSAGLLSYSRIIDKQIHELLTLSANLNIGNVFSTSLSYTAANDRYDNIGAGLSIRAGIAQFYLLSDRIPIKWTNINIDNKNIPMPETWNTINLRLGMNLVFGNRTRGKNDKPMIMVE